MRKASQVLAEDHGIHGARPGAKVDCPWCGHRTLSIKGDDLIAKCFHPQCGRFLVAGQGQNQYENGLHRILEEIHADLHTALLELKHSANKNAYSYLVQERKIHPRVVADSMLGAIPSSGYYFEDKFQRVIEEIGRETSQEKASSRNRKGSQKSKQLTGEEQQELLSAAKEKLCKCIYGHAGWLAFFYTDAFHRIVSIRYREPYSHNFVYFKPLSNVTGLFGHGLFSPYPFDDWKHLNDNLIVTEGEFNQLQLESLSVRMGETEGHCDPEYINCCAVGGVNNADYSTIRIIARSPILWYDNDSEHAGLQLVEKARQHMSVSAFTSPQPNSDPDSFIKSFGTDYKAAWEAVKNLLASRKVCSRIYSETGVEFLRGEKFIPKRLAEAIMDADHFKFVGEMLWVYRNGVYRPEGEEQVRSEAQRLLGEERFEKHVNETLRFIETANHSEGEVPNLQYINVRNGRLNLATGVLEPHSPDKFEIAQIPVQYDPAATCPNFDQYLESTFDQTVIPLVEEISGHCLIPDTRSEKAVMLVGSGENGKSVFLDTETELIGPENVASESLHDLEENRFRVANLYGKLANICADLDDRELESSQMFKKIVTGDNITGERKFGHPFQFRPYARLLFSANTLPLSKDVTYAFYRRWIIIPFNNTFEGDKADENLREKLRAELPGILNRALSGLRRLLSSGKFTEPAVVQAALKDYERQNSSAMEFIAMCVRPQKDGTVKKQLLYGSYRCWCEEQGLRFADQRSFKESLEKAFPEIDEWRSGGGHGKWHWLGVALTDDAPRSTDGDHEQ